MDFVSSPENLGGLVAPFCNALGGLMLVIYEAYSLFTCF
jgi:hypothetical protein